VTAVYLAAFVVGGIAVLSALVLTDIGHSGMPFLSLTGLSGALLGAGTGGMVATWAGLGTLGAGAIALASALILVLVLHGVLLPYLRRQESNSQHGRCRSGPGVGFANGVTRFPPVTTARAGRILTGDDRI
jgi:hypothetical protein